MPMTIGDLVTVTFRGTLYGQRVMTTFGWRVMNAVNAGDTRLAQSALADAISADVGTSLMGTYLASTTPALTVNEIWTQRIRPIRMRKTVKLVSLQGTNGASPNTPNVSGAICRKSDLGGRSALSNLRIPGITLEAGQVSAGVLSVGHRTLLDDLARESYEPFSVTNGVEVITYQGVIINKITAVPDHQLITAHTVNHHVRVSRRRTVGLGE